MVPSVNRSSRTNYHQSHLARVLVLWPVGWKAHSASLTDLACAAPRVCNSGLSGFTFSLASMIPDMLWPLTCCVTLDKPLPLSGPLLLQLLNEKLEVGYLRGSSALRISQLVSP